MTLGPRLILPIDFIQSLNLDASMMHTSSTTFRCIFDWQFNNKLLLSLLILSGQPPSRTEQTDQGIRATAADPDQSGSMLWSTCSQQNCIFL